jgi:hypothetical protein
MMRHPPNGSHPSGKRAFTTAPGADFSFAARPARGHAIIDLVFLSGNCLTLRNYRRNPLEG